MLCHLPLGKAACMQRGNSHIETVHPIPLQPSASSFSNTPPLSSLARSLRSRYHLPQPLNSPTNPTLRPTLQPIPHLKRPSWTTEHVRARAFDVLFTGFVKTIKRQNRHGQERRKLLLYSNVVGAFQECVNEAIGQGRTAQDLVAQVGAVAGRRTWKARMGCFVRWNGLGESPGKR